MAAGRLVIPGFFPALDRNGDPVSGAKMYVYQNETTTLVSIYSDEALTTPLTNPVSANSAGGWPPIWADRGTDEDPVAYSVSIVGPTGRVFRSPNTFDDVVPSVDADTAAAILAEASAQTAVTAADNAVQSATEAAASADEAEAAAAGVPAMLAGKANTDFSNVDAQAGRFTLGAAAYGPVEAVLTFASLKAASDAAVAAGRVLRILAGTTWSLSGNETYSADFIVDKDAEIFNQPGNAPRFTGSWDLVGTNQRIFFGDDNIQGIRCVYPEWFGAAGDGSTDDTAPLQAALRCAFNCNGSAGTGIARVLLQAKNYKITNTLLVYATQQNPIGIFGAGALPGGAGTTITSTGGGFAAFAFIANYGFSSILRSTFIQMHDLRVVAGVGAAPTGIFLGSTDPAKELDNPYNYGALSFVNVYVENFTQCVFISNARHWRFNNCTFRHDTGDVTLCTIQALGDGFSGDGEFIGCTTQLIFSETTPIGVAFSIDATSSLTPTMPDGGNVRGIIWQGCDIYNGNFAFKIKAQNQGAVTHQVGEYRILNCQIDGRFNRHFDIELIDGAIGADIRVQGGYMHRSKLASVSVRQTTSATATPGKAYNHVWDSYWKLCDGRSMEYTNGGTNIQVIAPQLENCGISGSSASEHFFFNEVDNCIVTNPQAFTNNAGYPGLSLGVNFVGASTRANNGAINTAIGTTVGAQNNQTSGGTNPLFTNVAGLRKVL